VKGTTYKVQEEVVAYETWGSKCLVCGKPANQLAHILPQRKDLLARYGYRIIHSRYNRLPACSLKCNAALQERVVSDIAVENIAKKIMAEIVKEKE
jgi:hypothetical protein